MGVEVGESSAYVQARMLHRGQNTLETRAQIVRLLTTSIYRYTWYNLPYRIGGGGMNEFDL